MEFERFKENIKGLIKLLKIIKKSRMRSSGLFILAINLHYIWCMYSMIFLFISGGEIFFILFIVVMVFGADKIPGIAKGLGKGMRQLKDATEDIKREIQKSAEKQGIDTSITDELQKDFQDVKKKLDDVGGTIRRK